MSPPSTHRCLVPSRGVSWVQMKPGVLVSSQLPAGLDAATVEDLALRQRKGDDVAAQALAALRCRGVFAGAPLEALQYTDHPQSSALSKPAATFAGLGACICRLCCRCSSDATCCAWAKVSRCLLLICAFAVLQHISAFSEEVLLDQLATNTFM